MTKKLTAEEQATARCKLGLPSHFCSNAICANATSPLVSQEDTQRVGKLFATSVGDEYSVWVVRCSKTLITFTSGQKTLQILITELRKQMNRSSYPFVFARFSNMEWITFDRAALAYALR